MARWARAAPGPRASRLELVQRRALGLPFEQAWPLALRAALAANGGPRLTGEERRDWRVAFAETRLAWSAAYRRVPAGRAERALLVVAVDPERVPFDPRVDRECDSCHGPIAPELSLNARYCSKRCRDRAHEARRVAA